MLNERRLRLLRVLRLPLPQHLHRDGGRGEDVCMTEIIMNISSPGMESCLRFSG